MSKTFLGSLCLVGLLGLALPTLAAVQDSDLDSLTDEGETQLYHTNPTLYDTDGDRVGDGEEIVDGTNPLDPSSSHLAELKKQDVGILGNPEQRAWYFGRATGLAAFVLFTCVVIYGLLIKSQLLIRLLPGATLTTIHEYLSLSALALVVVHLSSFFFDRYLHINWVEAFVPFTLERNFRSALGFDIGIAVTLGIMGLYLAVILIATSLYREKLPLWLWRAIHYLSYIFYLLIVLHGLAAGTDSASRGVQALYTGSLFIVTLLVVVRIASALKLRRMLAAAKAKQRQAMPLSDQAAPRI